MTPLAACDELGPWNPGIRSQLPAALLRLATIFRAENVFTGFEQAHERSAFTGLDPEDLVAFRPERLVVHELLIRVMGDFSVPDGQDYADLGVNFREIVETIHRCHIDPHMADIVQAYDELRRRAAGADRKRAVHPLRGAGSSARAGQGRRARAAGARPQAAGAA